MRLFKVHAFYIVLRCLFATSGRLLTRTSPKSDETHRRKTTLSAAGKSPKRNIDGVLLDYWKLNGEKKLVTNIILASDATVGQGARTVIGRPAATCRRTPASCIWNYLRLGLRI